MQWICLKIFWMIVLLILLSWEWISEQRQLASRYLIVRRAIAFPLCTIKRTKFSRDIKEIEQIIREYEIGGYVLGYPLNMDGSAGPRCQSIRDFGLEFHCSAFQ